MFLILFSSVLPPEGLEIITGSSIIYACLRDDGDFEAEAVWGTEKTMGTVSRADIISALRELTDFGVGNRHVHN